MMKITKLISYQVATNMKQNRFVMPFVAILLFLCFLYSIIPLDVTSGFLITGIFLFFLMVWVGMSVAQHEDEVEEQILFFRMNTAVSYYCAKSLFLILIALIFAILCTFFPVIQNALKGFTFFVRPLTTQDVINALIMMCGSSICGILTGNLMHPRVIRSRRLALGIIVFMCVGSIASADIVRQTPNLKYIFAVFPPILFPMQVYGNAEYFDLGSTFLVLVVFLVYGTICAFLKGFICHKKRF